VEPSLSRYPCVVATEVRVLIWHDLLHRRDPLASAEILLGVSTMCSASVASLTLVAVVEVTPKRPS